MSIKLTVSEYAKRLNVSVQTVYKKVKRGGLTTVKENNITYVVLDNDEGVTEVKQEVSQSFNNGCKPLLKIIKQLQKQNKTQDKEIRRLTKKNEKQNKFLISKYENALPAPKKDDDFVDVKIKKKKKKKKK